MNFSEDGNQEADVLPFLSSLVYFCFYFGKFLIILSLFLWMMAS